MAGQTQLLSVGHSSTRTKGPRRSCHCRPPWGSLATAILHHHICQTTPDDAHCIISDSVVYLVHRGSQMLAQLASLVGAQQDSDCLEGLYVTLQQECKRQATLDNVRADLIASTGCPVGCCGVLRQPVSALDAGRACWSCFLRSLVGQISEEVASHIVDTCIRYLRHRADVCMVLGGSNTRCSPSSRDQS